MDRDGAAPVSAAEDDADRIVAVAFDPVSLGGAAPHVAHERDVAARDLIETNRFAPLERAASRWRLALALRDQRLALEISDAAGAGAPVQLSLPLSQLRRLIKDYYLTCDSYYAAVPTASDETIAAIDQARKAIHDQGATLINARLADTVAIDFDTARRLFTLVATLFWHG